MHETLADTRAAPLVEKLEAIRARYPTAEPEWVADVVTAVLASLEGEPSTRQLRLLQEVEDLGRTIANAKAEISALCVDEITASHIPLATDELDAIISHTSSATDSILESCEILDSVAVSIKPDAALRLQEATTRIYEACSFHDITGQRIAKVITALKSIEARISHILTAFDTSGKAKLAPPTECGAKLLNGPQLPADAMAQADIDQLLASID